MSTSPATVCGPPEPSGPAALGSYQQPVVAVPPELYEVCTPAWVTVNEAHWVSFACAPMAVAVNKYVGGIAAAVTLLPVPAFTFVRETW